MNEQQIADRFSKQVDRLLAGESPVAKPGAEPFSELLNLSQQLTQVNFQAGPAAQAAFQNQVGSWFGPPNGSLTSTVLGIPKGWFLGLVAVMAGAGLVGLAVLLGTTIGLTESQHSSTTPAATDLPALVSPEQLTSSPTEALSPAAASPTATKVPPSVTPEAQPQEPSLQDTLPTPVPSVGDTIPTLTPTPEPTDEELIEERPTAQATGGPDTDNNDNGNDGDDRSGTGPPEGDHDHGHGNDPDQIDEDNPGQSGGAGGSGGGNGGQGGGQGGGQKGGHKRQ